MKSLKDFNYLLSLDRRYTKTESEIFRDYSDELLYSLLNSFHLGQQCFGTENRPIRGLL